MINQSNVFLSPRLVGKRFEQHGLPLDILKDFSVLNDMIKSVAKSLYKIDHPQRQRIPRNFLDEISLQIVGVEEGSTIPKIALVCLTASSELLATPAQEYAERARDCIIETIDSVTQENSAFSSAMTQAQLLKFERFGCSLEEGEAIQFPVTGTERVAAFNREVRRFLVSRASSNGYQESIHIYGAISEIDQDKRTFLLNLIEGQRIPAKYEEDHIEDVIAAVAKYNQGQKVLIQGTGKYSASGRLESIEAIENIAMLDAIDFGYQLAEIAALPPGWLDGRGEKFDTAQLHRLGNLFRENYTLEKDPWLFPAQDHLLLAEWENEAWRMSMEIDLTDMKGNFYALNTETDQDYSKDFDLQHPEQWKSLCNLLNTPAEGVQG